MMDWIVWGVGCIAIVAISMVAIAASLAWFGAWLEKLWERNDDKTRQLAAADLGDDLIVNSYWFSEDTATAELLKKIGEKLIRSRTCGFEPSGIRDEWRRIREQVAATSSDTTKDGDS